MPQSRHGRGGDVRFGSKIVHRLAAVRGADRIIVLQDGAVVETGPHDALVAAAGLYAWLYRLNYASFDDVPHGALDR